MSSLTQWTHNWYVTAGKPSHHNSIATLSAHDVETVLHAGKSLRFPVLEERDSV